MKTIPTIAFLSLLLLALACNTGTEGIYPTDLRCEYMQDPAVVDVLNPRLSWINISDQSERNQEQTAWQIRVASSTAMLQTPDFWDSEKVLSNKSARVEYAGTGLSSGDECWWQVRVWDKRGMPSDWSSPAFWRMGLLDASEWKADWIGAPWQGEEALPVPEGGPDGRPEDFGPPAPLLRKEFILDKSVEKAVLYTTGLGYFEAWMNGQKIGDDELVPNQTNYGKRPGLPERYIPLPDDFRGYKVMYLAYDVKDLLQEGENVIGGILGNGFYNPAKFWTSPYGSPRFIAQLHLTYTDGSKDLIVTDDSWKAAESAIKMNMVYYGEIYDARDEKKGWSTAAFDDTSWEQVAVRKAPFGDMVAHTAYTDKVVETLEPVSVGLEDDGSYLVDFGVEVSGRVRLFDIAGKSGQRIEIEYLSNTYSGDNTYICGGMEGASYASRFNWFVFSAVRIKNWPGELKAGNLVAEVVNTEIEESALFETSNQRFNDINKIWKRSQTDNMHGGIASDCPHRERSAYTGDGQVACVTVMHNFDARNFYQKWISDIHDAQIVSTGYVPNGAPWQAGCGGGVAWGAAIAIMPWEFYLQYGARDILEDNYHAMKGYVSYMKTWLTEDGTMYSKREGLDGKVLKWFNLGEWAGTDSLPPDELVHTFYFWYCSDIVSKVAAVLGEADEAKVYAKLAEQSRQAFSDKFFNEESGSYGNYGADILALRMGVPTEQYEKVLAALRANIKKKKGHLDTGIFGTRFFFEVLAENGMQDLACAAMNKDTYPSFGYGLKQGATTTWEHWDGKNSQNHPMFGGGLVWFYRNLAGMQTNPEKPGYRHIVFKPQLVESLGYVRYFNKTPYGDAGIHWEINDKVPHIEIKVPVSCTAILYFPTQNGKALLESGRPLAGNEDIIDFSIDPDYTIIHTGSGSYDFHF